MRAPQNQTPAIIWFRQDLRLTDHAALGAAMAGGRAVVPVYVLDDEAPGQWAPGGASRWWLHHSLASLQASLQAAGGTLTLRRGRTAEVLAALMAETAATEIHAGRMHEPWARTLETELAAALPDGALHLHRTATLFDLEPIRTKTGGIYGMYTPFARTLRATGQPAPCLAAPERFPAAPAPRSDRLDAWYLLPTKPDWAAGFRATWTPGEHAAQARLAAFTANAVHAYHTGRNLPGEDGTSMLSAHLHWGELSPAQVWHAASDAAADAHAGPEGRDVFLSEILWREFAAYLLWHNPHLPEQPLRPRFAKLPFRHAPKQLHAWQRGRTGIPIVDAGMRQLWQIGWMHNRVRMIAASFLVKHLLTDWREGEAWFWDTLVDADLASNAASWQWIAGSGIDSQPFFRVFNPVTQGQKFDPAGAYVRRWVPELADLPDRHVHTPWTAPSAMREGLDYPAPVIDLSEGRQRALDAYRNTVREAAE